MSFPHKAGSWASLNSSSRDAGKGETGKQAISFRASEAEGVSLTLHWRERRHVARASLLVVYGHTHADWLDGEF